MSGEATARTLLLGRIALASIATAGIVGATGRATGPHLHWSVRLDGARVAHQRGP